GCSCVEQQTSPSAKTYHHEDNPHQGTGTITFTVFIIFASSGRDSRVFHHRSDIKGQPETSVDARKENIPRKK
ncbi:hypothetical protein LI165_13475, partial [Phascolarctobacterium faecium]|uniref:hypothetical protein n=1 Tax=Phascolarctobacterium faecium TaxID=33025 RepID=UPI001D05CC8C